MFDRLALDDEELPEPDLSNDRITAMLDDIKRNSRNRRIAMVAPLVLAAAVLGAMVAAPPRHGGLTEVADAEAADPLLPRVFGSNGEWRLPERIEDGPEDPGPADMIQAPTEPSSPDFTLSPPDHQELQSLPTSTSTPPTSTSGQTPGAISPADLDWSMFRPEIRIEPEAATSPGESADSPASAPAEQTTQDTPSSDGNVTVAEDPHHEQTEDRPEATPSTPQARPDDDEAPVLSTPATIVPLSVPLVTGAHVSVTVQVLDDDSSVIDWCNTRVDWGDGSVTRVAGSGDADPCTATCEYESTPSEAGAFSENGRPGRPGNLADRSGSIDEIVEFEHAYSETIDVTPRIFVATGDGCSYTLAELQLPRFTVVPPS